ncbi:hypothetical protein [Acinetobacter pollinis]|uniref:hypothetical protein n=1 Tax=Acinetobacter pollinis TaxID=2605270 RepID=UPI0018C2B2E2|nr:hypothetical protein [Acinetobacter pollinis]MBF7694023.1 hypothetical protein [Acinetobacter pollinis]MBF7701652.1 hypothetical protein [Acinetobacter pollinis]
MKKIIASCLLILSLVGCEEEPKQQMRLDAINERLDRLRLERALYQQQCLYFSNAKYSINQAETINNMRMAFINCEKVNELDKKRLDLSLEAKNITKQLRN